MNKKWSEEKPHLKIDMFTTNKTDLGCYLLGLLWADGYTNGKHSIRIETIRKDMEYFYPLFQETGSWKVYYRDRIDRQPQSICFISSIPFVELMKEIGFISFRKSFSKLWGTLKDNEKNLFLLGLFDGDGCFYTNNKNNCYQLSFSGRGNQDWTPIYEIIDLLGLRANLSLSKLCNSSTLRLCGKNAFAFGDWMYKNTHLGLPRKREKFFNTKENLKV